jgi:hypothetical protein
VPVFSRLTCRCGHPRAEHKHSSTRFPWCALCDCAWFSPRFIDWLRSLLTRDTWRCAACGRRNHPAVPFCTRCLKSREDPAA